MIITGQVLRCAALKAGVKRVPSRECSICGYHAYPFNTHNHKELI